MLSPGQAHGGCFLGCGREREVLCQKFFFFFFHPKQHTDIWLVLKSSNKSLWFQLPCFKSNAGGLGLVGGRAARRNSTTEQMGCVSHTYRPAHKLRLSFFQCVLLFRSAMGKMVKAAVACIKSLYVSAVRNQGTQSPASPCGLCSGPHMLPSFPGGSFKL